MKPSFKVIIAGSRSFSNYELLKKHVDKALENKIKTHDIIIISGAARGADRLGENYAKDRGFKLERYPADWDNYGKRAGYIRNEQMAKIGNACIVFWDGISKGTCSMINLAKLKKLKLKIIKFKI